VLIFAGCDGENDDAASACCGVLGVFQPECGRSQNNVAMLSIVMSWLEERLSALESILRRNKSCFQGRARRDVEQLMSIRDELRFLRRGGG
jgi:hypothetical protein